MNKTPNNFPREGQHNTITRDHLNALEAARSKPKQTLEYTIGGAAETRVHSNTEAEREYALNSGHRRFKEISDKLQNDHVFSANNGHSKGQFNKVNAPKKTYADMQREAAAKARSRTRTRER